MKIRWWTKAGQDGTMQYQGGEAATGRTVLCITSKGLLMAGYMDPQGGFEMMSTHNDGEVVVTYFADN